MDNNDGRIVHSSSQIVFLLSNNMISINFTNSYRYHYLLKQFVAVLLAIFLTKVLSLREIGEVELIFFYGYLFFYFWTQGFSQEALRSVGGKNSSESDIFQFYLVLISCGLVILLISVFSSLPLFQEVNITSLRYFFGFLCLMSILEVLPLVFYKNEKFKLYIGITSVTYGSYLLIFAGLFWYFGFSDEVFKWIFIYGLIVHGILFLYVKKHFVFKFSLISFRSKFKSGVPFSLYALLGAFAMIFDAWLIQYHYQDAELFAVYRYGARELPLLGMLIFSTSNSIIPSISSDLLKGVNLIRKETTRLIKLYLPIVCLLMLISPFVFPLIFTPDFKQSSIIFNTYILIMISRLMFSHTILLGKGDHRTLLNVSLLELVINVLLSILFMQYWGVLGIVYATVIAFIFEKLIYTIIVKKRYNQSFAKYTNTKWFFIFSMASILSYMLSIFIYDKV